MSPRRSFRMETLERRDMKAGDVAAYLQNGNLILNEAAGQLGGDNGVQVSQLANGNIRVEGISAAGGAASLINGQASQEFTVTGGLYVNFGAGKDKVQFAPNVLGETVNLGELYIDVGAASAAGDEDKDFVSLTNFKTRGSLTVLTGASGDQVYISQFTIGDGVGADQAVVRTGAGGDTFMFKSKGDVHGSVDVQMFDSLAEVDIDTFSSTGLIGIDRTLTVRTGAGDDYFGVGNMADPMSQANHLIVHRGVTVETGDGVDQVLIAQLVAGTEILDDLLVIRSGAGADTVTIDNSWLENLSIQTYDSPLESDADAVMLKRLYVAGDVTVETGGGDDMFFITDPADANVVYGGHMQSLYVNTGDGADRVHVEGANINGEFGGTGDFTLYTGAGADTVLLDFTPVMMPGYGQYILRVTGDLRIQTYDQVTEADADNVRLIRGAIDGSIWAKLGAGDDTFRMEAVDQVLGDVDLEMDAGNDTAHLSGFILDHVMAKMGEGNDVLDIGRIWAYRLIALGDNGIDRLTKGNEVYAQYVDQFGWEYINGVRQWQPPVFQTPTKKSLATMR
jgi:hypothetical protein